MALFAKTLQRKLLGILLLVAFGPAVVALVYNYSVFSLGFENVLGTFLQDRAEQVAGKIDTQLQTAFNDFTRARTLLTGGKELESININSSLLQQIAITDRQGKVIGAFPASELKSVDLLPGLNRGPTTSPLVLVTETLLPDGTSRLVLQSAIDGNQVLTAYCEPAALINATEEMIGSTFLKVYSNRGIFPGQPDDANLRGIIAQHDPHIRDQLGGWLNTADKREPGALIGFAESKLLRMKRNEGATTVEWVVFARLDVQEVSSLLSYMMWRNILFAVLLAPILVALSYFLARRFLAPVRIMHEQAQRIGRGDLDATADVHTGDELEQLAGAFNSMAGSLRSSREALDQYLEIVERKARRISLESTVSKRLIGPFDLDQLGQATHEELKDLLLFDGLTLVVFSTWESPGRRFWFDSDVFADCTDIEVQSVCEDAFSRQTPSVFPAVLRLDATPVKALAHLDFEHCCVVPLRAESGLSGVLALGRKRGDDFSAEECVALEQIAGVLAIGVEHIGLYERTRSFALELEQKVEERAAELQRAQEQLFRIERFAATGRLAANIAHEINNPLGVIKNYLHLFRQRHKQLDTSSVEALDIVQQELDRIARIVRNLLDFYRPGPAKPEQLSLGDEIANLMPLLEAGLRKRQITLKMQLDASIPPVEMPRDHLRQVLLNLLKNAEEAVENRGEITVRTGSARMDDVPQILLEVSDNGCGIPLEDQAQVFEPFFTRKREGQPQGTGLGLAVTYSIVQSLGGIIDLESRPGHGTSIRIYIPCEAPVPNAAPPPALKP